MTLRVVPAPAAPEASPADASDLEIVRRVLAGERELFEVVMRRHNQKLYRVVRAVLRRDGAEVEDVLQQAYVNAYTHLDQFAGDAKLSTWLVRIALNEALGRLRDKGRRRESDLGPEMEGGAILSPAASPEDQASAREMVAVLEEAVETLPENARVVFVLREIEGLSVGETAACLGVTEEVVRVRLFRAKAALRDHIERRIEGSLAGAFPFHATRCDRVVVAVLARIGATLARSSPVRD